MAIADGIECAATRHHPMQAVCIMGLEMTKLPIPGSCFSRDKAVRTQGTITMLQFFKPGLRISIFGARLLVAFAAPCPVHGAFAQEAHPHAQNAVGADESAFLAENDAAMTKMMNDMAAKPSGDIDRDFVAMMAPHHQGAIDMAVIELRYGRNEQLRRIAQEIIVSQLQEIAAMKLAIGEQVLASAPAPTQPDKAPVSPPAAHDQMNMKK
jgi:hypothetical protein